MDRKLMLRRTIFNENSYRNGLTNQPILVQIHLHCESLLSNANTALVPF
jgi:hypothetical protein